MKTFVTGADGFIGSHLAEALVKAGHDVTAMAWYNSFDSFGWLDECQGMKKVRGDIRDAEQMRALIKGHDIVFHLAAQISVPYSYQAPRSFIDTNVIGTLNVLEACREAGAKIVHTSTSEVYGTAQYTPQDEKHPLQAQSPYAASKIAADKLVESFHLTYGLPAVTLRPFNTYGPRQSERAVIPTIIRQALDPVCRDIELGYGWTKRDFNYVGDTVRAFLSVADLSGVFNAGSGMAESIGNVATLVADMTGSRKFIASNDDSRARPPESEVRILMASSERLESMADWRPEVELEEGLRKTIDWWRTRTFRPDAGMVA